MHSDDNIRKIKLPMSELESVISEILSNGDKAEFMMTGDSMLPFFHDRKDVAVVERVDTDNIKKYDVLFYKRANGQYVLHRVVSVNDNVFDLCGDAQYTVEKGVCKEAVIGRLCGFYSHKKPDRYVSCNEKGYRLKAALWVNSRPLRYFFFRVKRKLNLSR